MTFSFKKSNRKNKKYSVITPSGKVVHFGDKRYQHYKDQTPLKIYSNLNHNDIKRRKRYLSRAKGIKNKSGNLTYKDKNSSNYYSINYLW
jgi:hypothetical protein